MSKRAGARRFPSKLLALENGEFFDDWTTRVSSGGSWSSVGSTLVSWLNNNGASEGLAEFRLPYSAFSLAAPAPYEDAHTVHARTSLGNPSATVFSAIGPATTIHTSAGVGNCYAAIAQFSGTPIIGIVKFTAGVPAVLATQANVSLHLGDVLSLAYRWDTGDAEADLSVLVNGVVKLSFSDSSSPYRMSTTTGKFGLFGSSAPAIPASYAVGHKLFEFWVTDTFESFEEPPSRAELRKNLRLVLLKRQRFADDPVPKIHRMIFGALSKLEWTYKRIGGCGTLKSTFRYADSSAGVTPLEDVDARTFDAPDGADWSSGDWMGGELVLEFHYTDSPRLDITTIFGVLPTVDQVWRGRVSKVDYDPNTGEIKLQGEGLVREFDEVHVTKKYESQTIRNIITDLIQNLIAKDNSGPVSARDTYTRFAKEKIVGLQSALDLRVSIEFKGESAGSAISKLFEFFPPGAVWGVDREGDFFLSQQTDHYTVDLDSSGGTGIQHFQVDRHATRFSKEFDFSRIRTIFRVLGRETDEGGSRVEGIATSERARILFGYRETISSDANIQDAGLAAKVAAVQIKRTLIPAISARLSVVTPLTLNRDLWQSLVPGAPRVSIDDRRGKDEVFDAASLDALSTEYLLRYFGDRIPYSMNEKGSAGGKIVLTSTTKEQALGKSFIFHAALRFDYVHPGVSGNLAMTLGRPFGTLATDLGWGALWWDHNAGNNLFWIYTDAGGALRTVATGIRVDPVTPAAQEVHLTVWRDSLGDWRIYDGNTLKNTDATLRASAPKNVSTGWEFWKTAHASLPVNYLDHGDVTIEEVWLLDSTAIEANASGGVVDFIAANNDNNLRRNRAEGLLLYLPGHQQSSGVSAENPRAWQVPSASTTPVRVFAQWTKSDAGGTQDGAFVSTGARRGVIVDPSSQTKTKRWGGPLVFNSETVKYALDLSSGMLERTFTLGEIPSDLFTTIASIQDEIRIIEETLRRTNTDF